MQFYFLCTGNACRSQMAEGFAKRLLGPSQRVASAGIEAQGLNPLAVQVMAERGIDISAQQSKVIDPDYLKHCDWVITLCGDARDRCPVVPKSVQKAHWPLVDPALASGSQAQQLEVFRQVRDAIEVQVKELKDTIII